MVATGLAVATQIPSGKFVFIYWYIKWYSMFQAIAFEIKWMKYHKLVSNETDF